MKTFTIPMTVIGTYAIIAFFVFAVAASETLLLYPNIFRDIPESLELTQEFMSVVAVGEVMRPLGAGMLVSALIAGAVSVRYRIARRWLACSLTALVSGQFLLSIRYLWPRASILFDDRNQHTLDEIERAAGEFEVGQYFRIAAAGLAALFAVVSVLDCYRARVLATVR
ncbi:hypothetical protein AB0H00_30620 [Nocardia sp. NPDC023852]|uniref:hypothetical protein n=1 Tax=Nocardia sp. NPDC023852 TaxID=3154697 RepID=UPI0034092B9F